MLNVTYHPFILLKIYLLPFDNSRHFKLFWEPEKSKISRHFECHWAVVVHTDPHWMVRIIAGQIQLRDSPLDWNI